MSQLNVRDAIAETYDRIVAVCESADGQKKEEGIEKFLNKELRPLLPESIEFDFAFYESGVQYIFFEKANPRNAIIL